MITYYIISIIIALIFLFVARIEEYDWNKKEYIDIHQGRIKYPVWMLLIGVIALCIPMFNIISFSLIYVIMFLHYCFTDDDYRIRLFPKIIKEILTKKI
jgi:hypothetical protein